MSKVTKSLARRSVERIPLLVAFPLRLRPPRRRDKLDQMADSIGVSRNELLKTHSEDLVREFENQMRRRS